jgi:chromate transporter
MGRRKSKHIRLRSAAVTCIVSFSGMGGSLSAVKRFSWQSLILLPVCEFTIMNIMFDLFLTFARIGLFTFGGGYAMISLIENSCVEKKQWITHDEMMNVTVIAESTPGPIAINCATFVGYKQKGFTGAISATIGMVLPSFSIIFLISMFLDNFLEITWIAHAFMGIKIAVGILILDAAIKMIKKMQKKPIPLTITICAFAAMLLIDIFALRVSSITLMLIAAVISLAIFLIKENTGKAGAAK